MLRLFKSLCRIGGVHKCKYNTPWAIYIANLLLSYHEIWFYEFWRYPQSDPFAQYSRRIL